MSIKTHCQKCGDQKGEDDLINLNEQHVFDPEPDNYFFFEGTVKDAEESLRENDKDKVFAEKDTNNLFSRTLEHHPVEAACLIVEGVCKDCAEELRDAFRQQVESTEKYIKATKELNSVPIEKLNQPVVSGSYCSISTNNAKCRLCGKTKEGGPYEPEPEIKGTSYHEEQSVPLGDSEAVIRMGVGRLCEPCRTHLERANEEWIERVQEIANREY